MPSSPYSVRLSAVSQRLATVSFMKPDSHGGVPIGHYLLQYRELSAHDWREVRSHSAHSEYFNFWCFPEGVLSLSLLGLFLEWMALLMLLGL